ncbi:hypothetical protein C8J56DRAFT_1057937 [Mycena floridula]|nr:hypothetical protein C8J56DRAFT_1057937 [Mycena floridula]
MTLLLRCDVALTMRRCSYDATLLLRCNLALTMRPPPNLIPRQKSIAPNPVHESRFRASLYMNSTFGSNEFHRRFKRILPSLYTNPPSVYTNSVVDSNESRCSDLCRYSCVDRPPARPRTFRRGYSEEDDEGIAKRTTRL